MKRLIVQGRHVVSPPSNQALQAFLHLQKLKFFRKKNEGTILKYLAEKKDKKKM